MALLEQCITTGEAQGELWLRSWALLHSGWAAWRLGDPQRARVSITAGLQIAVRLEHRLIIGHCLESLAWLAAADDPERAAHLLGAAHGVLQAIGAVVFPYLRADHDRCMAGVRAALGEKTFTVLFDRGAALPFDEAVADSLPGKAACPAAAAASRAGAGETSPLTQREQEVAALVAEGLTNKDIAARLVISRRTAEGHIEHIMTKLGFTSRAQIAAMITRHPKAV
jgi:non-specific serine/threonine protein kinase